LSKSSDKLIKIPSFTSIVVNFFKLEREGYPPNDDDNVVLVYGLQDS